MDEKLTERTARVRSIGMRDGALFLIAATAAVWILRAAEQVFVPIILAVFISYALEPAVSGLKRIGIPRLLGSIVLLLALTGGVGTVIYAFSDDVLAIVGDLPRASEKLRETFRLQKNDGVVEKVEAAADAIERTATEAAASGAHAPAPSGVMRVQIEEKTLDLSGIVLWGSVGMLSALGQVVLLLFLVLFLLISDDLFRKKLVKIAGPTLAKKRITVGILQEINFSIRRYVLVLLLTGSVVGITSTLAFHWIGLERAGVWGLAAGLFNAIPYFGPLMVSIAVAVVAFVQFGTIEMAIYVVLIAAVITTLEGYLLTPMLIGRAAQMNGVAVFVGLLFWSWVWGIWGMLLAAPMLVVMKSICDRIDGLKPIGELLGE